MFRYRIATLALVASVMLAACAGLGGEKPTIKIGSVNALTGPAVFPEASAAAKAVFDKVNAQGGINGRQIEYLVEDDKADPAVAAQAARRLVEDQNVVANVGSASLLECSVNADYYKQKGIVSIQGTGVDPVCFISSNISPVNTGPYLGVGVSLYFASEVLKKDKVCAFAATLPSFVESIHGAVKRWEQATGKALVVEDFTIQPTDDLTSFVLKAKSSGCNAVVFGGVEPQSIAWVQAASAQHVTGITWIFLTPAYTDNFAKVLAASTDEIYTNSEFEPYSEASSPALEDWRKTMTDAKVPLTSFAQGGYLAATIMVDVLKNIKGDITRESVTAALKSLDNYKTAFIGTPYSANKDTNNPNTSSKFLQLKGGTWTVATKDFVTLP